MSVNTSLVYKHPLIYELLMLMLYGSAYASRYQVLADLIPDGANVTDVCCGPAVLYHRYLKRKRVDYTGVDINAGFIHQLQRQGGKGVIMDVQGEQPFPEADYVLMQASLYHFLPELSRVNAMLDKMLAAARHVVIVAEPIRNLSDSNIPILSTLAKRSADPGTGHQISRFNEQSLDAVMTRFQAEDRLLHTELTARGREKIYVIQAAHPAS